MHGEVGQDGGIVRRQLQRLTPGGLGVGVARDLLIGHPDEGDVAPVPRVQAAQLVERGDSIEALAGGQVGAGRFQQGVPVGGIDDQHLLGRAGGFVVAAERAERGGEAHAGEGVAGIVLDFVRPEGGAGQGLQPLCHGAFLRARLARWGGGRRGAGGRLDGGRGG